MREVLAGHMRGAQKFLCQVVQRLEMIDSRISSCSSRDDPEFQRKFDFLMQRVGHLEQENSGLQSTVQLLQSECACLKAEVSGQFVRSKDLSEKLADARFIMYDQSASRQITETCLSETLSRFEEEVTHRKSAEARVDELEDRYKLVHGCFLENYAFSQELEYKLNCTSLWAEDLAGQLSRVEGRAQVAVLTCERDEARGERDAFALAVIELNKRLEAAGVSI